MQPTLMLDFDGTVCLGDDPVLAYAEAAASHLDRAHRDAVMAAVVEYLDAGGPHLDGYSAVAAAVGDALPAAVLSQCYLASRRALARGELEIEAPDGLADFLAALPARRVLVTNAPSIGIDRALATLGLTEVIDTVITGADKPHGLRSLVPTLLADNPPSTLLSVGDIWINDIAVPRELGCATALIDRFDASHGPADIIAPFLDHLYDHIRSWAHDLIPSHPHPASAHVRPTVRNSR